MLFFGPEHGYRLCLSDGSRHVLKTLAGGASEVRPGEILAYELLTEFGVPVVRVRLADRALKPLLRGISSGQFEADLRGALSLVK